MADAPIPGEDPPPPPPEGGWTARLGWPLAVMFAAACALMAFALKQCSPGAQAEKLAAAGGTVVQGMAKLAAAINQHQVTENFIEHVDSLKPDLNNRLLVAERQATEIFSAQDVSWLGTASAELRVPVAYQYYVALTGQWDLQVQVTPAGVVGEVVAPELHPLQPSINSSQLEMKNSNGWANRDGPQLQADLLRDLTAKLDQRAMAEQAQCYAAAHEAVEKFVRDWMLRQYNLAPGTPVYLHIRFRNEPAPALDRTPPKG